MKNKKLIHLRSEIDNVDNDILQSLAKRNEIVKRIGKYKKRQRIKPLDEKRWQEVLKNRLLLAEEFGLDPSFVKDMFETIHKQALKTEKNA